MGGIQQIDKLIRKNLLLKARRPKGTCFEFVLPLVLLLLLLIMRKEYESTIWYYGPSRFENKPIFPQTRRLMEIAEGTVSGFETVAADTQKAADSMVNSLKEQLLCDPSYTRWAEETLESSLDFELSLGGMGSGRSVADEVLRLDARGTAAGVANLVRQGQGSDVSHLVQRVMDGRSEYLGSQWARQLETSAKHIDQEVALLRAELESNGSGWVTSSQDARSRIEGWLNDACHLRGPMFDGWNSGDLARDLERLRKALDDSRIMGLLEEGRDALRSVSVLKWFDELTGGPNSSVTKTWFDRALDELPPSELTAWLRNIRYAVYAPMPMAWFNMTLAAIDSSELKSWLVELKSFVDSPDHGAWLNRTLDEIDAPEARKMLTKIREMMHAQEPMSWFNRTLEEIDSPELRRQLHEWLNRISIAMRFTRPQGFSDPLRSADLPQHFPALERLIRLVNQSGASVRDASGQWTSQVPTASVQMQNNTAQEMIWWTSHFLRPDSTFTQSLEIGHDAMRLLTLRGDVGAELRVQVPRLSRSMERLQAAFRVDEAALRNEANTTTMEIEKRLDEAIALSNRMSDLLKEVNTGKSLRAMVHEAFDQVKFDTSLHAAVTDAIQKVNVNSSAREEVNKILRQATFGGYLAQEVVDALRRVNFGSSSSLRDEVHVALRQANLDGALRAELSGALRMAKADLSVSLSHEVVEAVLQVNLSSSLRSELGDVLHRANISSCIDAKVTELLHEARGCLQKLDDQVAGWRRELDELFSRNSWADARAASELLKAVTDLTGLNATEIERDVLPAWKASWNTACTKVNVSKAGDLFERTQRGCPFYRKKVKALADRNVSRTLHGFHHDLRHMNATKLHTALQDLQNELQGLNATKVEGMVRKLLAEAQKVRSAAEEPDWSSWSSSKKVAHNVVKMVKDELSPGISCGAHHTQSSPNAWLSSWLPTPTSLATAATSSSTGGGDGSSKAGNFIQQEMLRRKVLVAPYKGEVRELWDLIMVEVVLLFTSTEHGGVPNKFLEALVRCPLVRGAMANIVKTVIEDFVLFFDSEQQLEKFAMDQPNDVLAAIVFRSADQATGNFAADSLDVTYAVRFHAQLMPSTRRVISYVRFGLFGGVGSSFNAYIDTGFAYVQDTIGRATARLRAKRQAAANSAAQSSSDSEISHNAYAQNFTAVIRRLSVGGEKFPTPQFKVDYFIYVIQFMLPMFMIMGWIYCVSLLVKEMVYEKQERLREVMRIQGLRTWVYWASWITFAMSQLSVLVLAMVLILCGGGVLQYSDPVVVAFFFLAYSGAVVSFAMLISACFSRAKVAAVCAGVAYYSGYLPYSIYNRFEESASLQGKCMFCLMCPTGLGAGISLIAKWELLEEGLQWKNMGTAPPMTNSGSMPNNNFSVGHVVFMMFVDMFVYQLLAWYIEKVFPGELGLPQPWYFPFLPSYWSGGAHAAQAWQQQQVSNEKDDNPRLECYEVADPELVAAVQVRKLAKIFPGGKKALKGISLDMHRGTILGLLGHNGAGKSTTMSILTGLYPPSEGDVLVNGCSVRKDSCGVRKQLGVCLQQNALYEALTVEEHLDLFCNLKSVPRSQVKAEVDLLLRDTGLLPKRHAPSRALSGGMKRKLSIGIALAGGSKVIALDEPTAGVDATSRRDIWQLLAAHKQTRAILLSTHFMDEADVLSDRIAIIAEGQLTAIGSSIGLKKRFADKYLLTIVASDNADPARLLATVRAIVPEAKCVGTRGREFSYGLPSSARPRFPGLFASLQDDDERKRLGVETYGLSAATMEEVFLMASSVHEEGLKGVVRNGGEADDGSEEASTASGGNSSRPHSGSSGDGRGDTPLARESAKDVLTNELTSSSGNSDGDSTGRSRSRGQTMESNEPAPFSPQCISATDEPVPPIVEVMPDANNAAKHRDADAKPVSSLAMDYGTMLSGPKLILQQFRARLWTRAKSARRDRKAWASQIVLPAMFVLAALVIAWVLETDEEEPALKLNTDMFIGTAAGSRRQLDEHRMPFSDMRGDAFSSDVLAAFTAAKGATDMMMPVTGEPPLAGGDGTDVLRQYIMDNKKDLRASTYAALNIHGHGETANLTLYYDNRGAHIIPAMVSMCNNARFSMLGYGDTRTEAWNHPLPKTQQLLESEMTGDSQVMTSLTVAVTVLLAMGFIPASFLVYLVHEKATNAKHQQLLSGVSPVMYWVSSYCWDMINVCIPVLFIFLLFVLFQIDAYSGRNALSILMLLLAYSAAMTPQMYCLEPLFSVPSTAYVTCIVLNIFTGTVSVLATTVLGLYEAQLPKLKNANTIMKAVFPWLLPNYSLGRGFMEVATNHYIRLASEEFGSCFYSDVSKCERDGLNWEVAGQFVFALAAMSGVWLGLRLLIEWRCFSNLLCGGSWQAPAGPKSGKEDDSVLQEEASVQKALQDPTAKGNSSEGSLIISNLSKTFMRAKWSGCIRRTEAMHSVKGISVSVQGGECFGLLGVNGAGKTTTMRMITGDIEVGGGDVLLSGWSVRTHRDQARRHLGYCPQFDALTDKLTTREALFFYARIRGVPPNKTQGVVDAMIKRMCLEAHQHRLCQHLSGGNKRKLSTALALIGEPDVVLLDEPSTGVDVGARRFLWDVLGEVRQRGHALVLTSHSMDECEVLCTRLTIMVSGEMRCLGTPLQLKSKYGGGYTLAVKAQQAREDDPPAKIRTFMQEKVPAARLTEENVGLFRYRLGGNAEELANLPNEQKQVPLAGVFATLEGAMQEGGALDGCVLDYTISQTSLEEVFLHFSQL